MNRKIRTSFLRLLFGVIGCFIVINCAWAAGVPKYNPNDPNPKPGLYRTENMNYARSSHSYVALNDGRVLIIGDAKDNPQENQKNIEIFDPKTGKFTVAPKAFYNHFRNSKAILLDDGRVLIGGTKNIAETDTIFFEIYDAEKNKFIDTKISINNDAGCMGFYYWIVKNNDGSLIIYSSNNSQKKIPGKLSVDFWMYKYDVKNNVISEPILSDSKDYISIKSVDKNSLCENPFLVINSDINSWINKHSETYKKLQCECKNITLVSRNEVDYNIKINSDLIENGKYKNKAYNSWFSPIYEYDIKTAEILKKYEYIRSLTGNAVKIQNRNMFLIAGGVIPAYVKNSNDDPKNISLKHRLNLGIALEYTKHSYIYVY